ncbi:MAG TPA: tetratricopeptide repeat protein [Candidatus Cybelea sp.]|nr:tetratricopeptide repeat protein [Candidatus Cybelea sp.]
MTLPALVIAVVAAAATSVHFPVSTHDPAAQAAVDRGLFLYYAYNGDEAARSFEAAATNDGGLAMARWGIALADGPDLNTPLSPAQFEAAQTAIRPGILLEGSASPNERRYLEIMAMRYAGTYAEWQRDDAAYRAAMLAFARSGSDENAKLLAAEALLEHGGLTWQNGRLASDESRTALDLVTAILHDDPVNPMANHLCIHLYDLAPDRRPALPCAQRLDAADFPPEAEHLTHMPAHFWIETGNYAAALGSSERTYAALQMLEQTTEGARHANRYLRHDILVGYSAAMMLGNYSTAQLWSRRVSGAYNSSFDALTSLRFGRYEDAYTLPEASYGNPSVRGIAALHLGHSAEEQSATRVNRDAKSGYLPQFLLSRIAESQGNSADARRLIEEAAGNQAATSSGELIPLIPAREVLGFFEMRRGKNAAAVAAFTQTLSAYPNDPRALYGLAAALTAMGRNAEAGRARARFSAVWKGADTTLAGADFP